VVAAESKRYARVRVLEIVIEAIEQSLRQLGREPVDIAASL
jgi:polyphosphate kinase 2 (PPK2 family)